MKYYGNHEFSHNDENSIKLEKDPNNTYDKNVNRFRNSILRIYFNQDSPFFKTFNQIRVYRNKCLLAYS